jgi:hypothetical protein
MVDDCDFQKAISRKWHLTKDGYARSTTTPYICLHQLVLGKLSSGKEVDHKNGDGLDCQKGNLRAATHQQNGANLKKQKRNKSGFKGVWYWRKVGKYQAYITKRKSRKHLGLFESAIEAAKAYDEAAKELFGEFAKTNFPMRFPRAA